jgi:peptidylprolyl isomerase/FKBP-type peptidyl-prolyl cis-trans isomerase FkpA
MRSLSAVLAGALLMVGIAGCSEATTKPQPESIETASFAASLGVDLAASTKTAEGAYFRDITVGTGAVLAQGDTATVSYKGFFRTGEVFDPGSTPLVFEYPPSSYIRGFTAGLQGLRVGGRRQIIVPPSLGYTQSGHPLYGKILVFDVTLVSKKSRAGQAS